MSFVPYDGPLHWPFLFVLDAQHRQTGWALLNGPVVTRPQREQFLALRRGGHRFIGISSYLDFPRGHDDDRLDYEMVCDGWCHCFRVPEHFLKTSLPRALISASDFTDYQRLDPQRVPDPPGDARFDLVYVGASEEWKREVKNWSLAARALPPLCQELGFRALVIGPPTPDFGPSERITFCTALPWTVLLAQIARARFLFVPNRMDASPRVIAEALCLDAPVLVHRDILGGWKYVNRFTGAFFQDENDVVAAARALSRAAVAPRAWFRANHGPYTAGKRLLSLIRSIDPALGERSFVRISEAAAAADPER